MTTLFDRPIEGDIRYYSSKSIPEQHDPSALLEKLDALLNIEGVEALKWEQYTPYFNDGDACEFGLGEVRVKITGDDLDEEDWHGGFREDFYTYDWSRPSVIRGYQRSYTEIPVKVEGVDMDAVSEAVDNLSREMPHHEVLLKKTFGDPAEVTATKSGFIVEFYDHE